MKKSAVLYRADPYRVIDLPGGIGIKYQNQLHTLNATAYEIFLLCDGNRTFQDIQTEMKIRYPENDVEHWVEQFIGTLLSAGLVSERNGNDLNHIIR
jgi:hypothetical protein